MEKIKRLFTGGSLAGLLATYSGEGKWLNLFVFILPFSYALQVIFFNKFVGTLPYIFLLVHLGVYVWQNRSRPGAALSGMFFNPLLYFSLFIGYAVCVEWAYAGPLSSGRLALIYLLPISLYFLYARGNPAFTRAAASLLVIAASIVAIQELYEFARLSPTIYEARHFLYVKAASGLELGKWQGAIRPGGMLDHIHAAAVFIGMGLIGAVILYHKTGARGWLVATALCGAGLLASGMRLPVAATAVSLFLTFILLRFRGGPDAAVRARAGKAITTAAVAMLLLFTVYRGRTTFWDFYYMPMKTGTLTPGKSFSKEIAIPQVKNVTGENHKSRSTALFGQGFMTTRAIDKNVMTDDFVLAQLYGNLGIVGLASFLSLFAYSALLFWRRRADIFSGSGHEALFAAALLLVLFLSLLHSGVALRRQIYPLIFAALGMLAARGTSGRDEA